MRGLIKKHNGSEIQRLELYPHSKHGALEEDKKMQHS
jgi:hypothetical protein